MLYLGLVNLFLGNIGGVGSRNVHGYIVYKLLEIVGLGNEVGLAVDLEQNADFAAHMDIGINYTFGSYTGRLLGGRGKALLAEILHGLVHIAIGLNKRALAVHHAGAAHLTQGHYVFCSKHNLISS